jgi:hypothetical protein
MAASIPRGYDQGKALVKKCSSNWSGPAPERSASGLNGCVKVTPAGEARTLPRRELVAETTCALRRFIRI